MSGKKLLVISQALLLTGSVLVAGAVSAPGAQGHQVQATSMATPASVPRGFSKRVTIPGGRKFYLECRGTGSPTVVLEAGTGDRGDLWSLPPSGGSSAVMPAVARFTRVCTYDRPGTYLLPNLHSRSDPVAMPRTARDIALDLRVLLRVADVPGPYVLVGHSFGGLVARLFAASYPRQAAGLVSIDAQNEDFVAAYKRLLTPEQYAAAVLDPQPPAGLEGVSGLERLSLEASAAQVRQAQADRPLRSLPVVIISHSRSLPNPFGFPADWPNEALERAFQDSQDRLAELVPRTRHVIATKSGHYIQLDQPRLVTRAIRDLVKSIRP